MIIHQEDIVEKEVEISNNTFIRSNIPLPSTTSQSSFSLHKMAMDYQTNLIRLVQSIDINASSLQLFP